MKTIIFILTTLIALSSFAAHAKGLRYVEEPNFVYPLIDMTGAYTYPRGSKNYWCAVDQVGLKCWGWLTWDVPSWRGITQLVSGRSHMCAMTGNGVACIGLSNEYGELDVPKIADPDRVFAGEFHNCVITKSKQVVCWGKNNYGQASPPASLEGTVSLSTSRHHTCALSETGMITCWGDNAFQQLEVPANLGIVQKLVSYYDKREDVGDTYWSDGTCAEDLFAGKAARSVCWGKNYFGPRITLKTPKVTDLEQRQSTNSYSCGLYEGTLLCEGSLPFANLPELAQVKSFSTGRYTVCAVKNNSSLICWGRKERMDRESRMQSVKEVQTSPAGDYHCASHSAGLSCWGSKAFYSGERDFLVSYGLTEQPSIERLDSFALSDYHACVVDTQNLKCWGNNKMSPPPQTKNIKLVAAGARFFCSLDFANEVQCWAKKNVQVKFPPKLKAIVKNFEIPKRYENRICVNYETNEQPTCWDVY